MEQEIFTQKEEVHEEKHYGRIVAIVITVAILGLAVWYGVTGKLSELGKVTVEVSPVTQTPSVGSTTVPVVVPPADQFIVTDLGKVEGSQTENIATADTKIFTAPINFKSFTYDASKGKVISISGNCSDKYYAVLVFDSAVDYRKNPSAARSNRAFECPATKLFNVEMNLRDINLQSGSYYVFIADQGSTGSWYNPR